MTAPARTALWLCFILSGAAALALEMLWMRSASLAFGQTAATTAAVLACYFTGLALGAAAGRRVRWRPVHAYGRLEIGAALGAAWSLLAFRILTGSGLAWPTGYTGSLAGIALAVLPATCCLGATLPVIGQALAKVENLGRDGALLTAANTLGGVLGTAALGFGLPMLIGVTASYAVAAAASLSAGVVALLVSRRGPEPTDTNRVAGGRSPALPDSGKRREDTPAPSFGAPALARLRLVAGGAGALGLALEVLWTRLFAQVLHNSIYSFSAIALVFLLALAAGATVAARALRRTPPVTIAGIALMAAAFGTVGGLWAFVRWTDGLANVGMHSGLGEYVLRIVAMAAISAGPAALASGAVLPALWALWGRPLTAARPLGDLASANLLGGVAGALAAAFVALPLLGLRGSMLAVAIIYVVLADTIAAPALRTRALAYAGLLAVAVLDPARLPLAHLDPDTDALKTLHEGASGIVTVVQSGDDLQLRLDNYYVLGGTAAETGERRLGLIPLLLHPHPRRVAFIGIATGITASAAPALGVADTTVVEVVPEVADAARAHFGAWNAGLLDRPDVHLVIGDGRHYLARTDRRYDVIVSDLFIPWHAGAGNLYSREMYEIVARRLAPDGLFCQWLPLYQLTREEFDVIAHTFLSVFPSASLWRADFYPDRPVVGLIAQRGAALDLERVRARIDGLPEWSRDPLLASPRGLVMLDAGNLGAAADLLRDAPINTDDRPLLEFTAPRLTRINAAGDKDWLTGTALAAFYDQLAERAWPAPDPSLPATNDVADARRAGQALYQYALAASAHDTLSADDLEATVRALVPEVIAAFESTDRLARLEDARREETGLREEQALVRQRLQAMERRLGGLASATKESP